MTPDFSAAPVSMTGTDTDPADRDPALRQAEELNRHFVESTGDCVKLLTPAGYLQYMNPEGLRALGLPDMSGLLNRALPEFFEGSVRTAAETAVTVARSGGRGRFQYSMRSERGHTTWWDAVITPMTDAFGTVTQLLAIYATSPNVAAKKRFALASTACWN